MAYERQSFKNGQVLKAEHLKCIEDCLCDMSPVADSFKFSTDCVGKMIRVAAVDKNGKPTKWETLDAAADASGSDVLLIDEDVEFISRGATIPRLPEAEFLPGQESDLVEGATYIVTWNGVEYECVAKRNGYDECFIGNEYLADDVNDTGEPFYIDSTSSVSYHIFKATSSAETISIKVIQRKKGYLPDGVPYVQTAAVGQTIVVSEVDADGKPTKWKAVSLPDNSGKVDKTSIVQDAGSGEGLIMSQKAVTEALGKKQPSGDYALRSELPSVPVKSVNGKTGAVSLSASDVGARPDTWTPTAGDVGADPAGTASGAVSGHNVSDTAHNDIRQLIEGLTTRLNALANSDDTTLDQMAELVAYIKANRGLIDNITTGKVSVSDIVDNLTTNVKNKPLSAAQGVALKGLIDKLSSGKLDVTAVADWAKAATKPSYKASEVGADPSGTAASAVSDHNQDDKAHQDIRKQIGQLANEKVDQSAIVQELGTDTSKVMSQAAVTKAISQVSSTGTANYTGKKILFMGDSITRQSSPTSGWVGIFNTFLQPSSFVNTAVVGAGWVETDSTVYDGNPTQTSNNVIGNQIEKIARGKDTSNPNYSAVADYAYFDIIIIAAGINDYSIKTDEPDIEASFTSGSSVVALSALDRKVFASAFRYNVERIKKLYPSAQLFICTPTQVALGARTYKSVKEKRDHIIALCERMSVTYIDTFMCGIYSVNEVNGGGGLHLNDGVHPNDAGKAVIADYNAREVIKHYIGGNAPVPEATYTNLVPTSINADGTIFNGVGYQNEVRIGSSGTLSTSGAAETTATGFIKVSGGDVVRVSGGDFKGSGAGNANAIGVYGKNGELPGSHLGTSSAGGTNNGIFGSGYSSYGISSVVEETTAVYKWIVPPTASGVEYIRISCWQNGDYVAPGANLVVTVNEEIT